MWNLLLFKIDQNQRWVHFNTFLSIHLSHSLTLCVHIYVVDHPTQLVFIWIFICWVGGGDPCGAAELCISGLWSQKKQARTDVFLKYPCHVHKDSPEAENGTKNFIKPTKNLFVSLNSQFVPISCSNFSGQIEFGLKSCSNQSGQIEFGLKSCCN